MEFHALRNFSIRVMSVVNLKKKKEKKRVWLNHKDDKVPPNISLSTIKFKGKFNGIFDSCISK